MSSFNKYSIKILDIALYYIHRCVLHILYILDNTGNIFNLIIFLKESWRKNICLFLNTCYINSSVAADILLSYNIVLCKLYTYITYILSILLPTLRILASIDRLLISSQNVDTRLYSSKRLAYVLVSVCTFIWFIYLLKLIYKNYLPRILYVIMIFYHLILILFRIQLLFLIVFFV